MSPGINVVKFFLVKATSRTTFLKSASAPDKTLNIMPTGEKRQTI
ncbi:hypothetical protein [Moritella viscosa]|nr:hypothetical protein [Moritella viscosa]